MMFGGNQQSPQQTQQSNQQSQFTHQTLPFQSIYSQQPQPQPQQPQQPTQTQTQPTQPTQPIQQQTFGYSPLLPNQQPQSLHQQSLFGYNNLGNQQHSQPQIQAQPIQQQTFGYSPLSPNQQPYQPYQQSQFLNQPIQQQQQQPIQQQPIQQQPIQQQQQQQINQLNYQPSQQNINPSISQPIIQSNINSINNHLNNPNGNISNLIPKNQYFTKEQVENFIDSSFENKIREWKNWTLSTTISVYLVIVLVQMLFLTFLVSPNRISFSSIFWTIVYLIGQTILCLSYYSIVSVYRQVPASFKESISRLSTQQYIFILLNSIIQSLFLLYLFSLPKNNFNFTLYKDNCFEDSEEGFMIKCQKEYNLFFPLFCISVGGLIVSIIFKTFSNQEFVYSFPKANISTILQIKSMIYNNFWISFYSSFYLFGIGSFLFGILLLVLFRTFTIQIIVYSGQLWCFTFVILFQNLLRYRLFEIYFTRNLRFSIDKFTSENSKLFDDQKPSNTTTTTTINTPPTTTTTTTASRVIANDQKQQKQLLIPHIDNPNIFLEKSIFSQDPLIQYLGWKDLLYISKFSESRRNHLYSEMFQEIDNPTILKIISKFEQQIFDLISILSCPREYYEPNYKKDDGDKKEDTTIETKKKENKFKINFSFSKFIKEFITKLTGIKFEYNAYDSEIKQALSNTQSILWSIEAIGSLIVSAQINDNPEVMNYFHKYQIPQKFLTPLILVVGIVEKLENDLQYQINLDKSILVQEYYFIKTLINQVEPPQNCIGVLQTSRPHFRIFKQISKNTISQVLETIGYQISDISFPYEVRLSLNNFKNGEFNI